MPIPRHRPSGCYGTAEGRGQVRREEADIAGLCGHSLPGSGQDAETVAGQGSPCPPEPVEGGGREGAEPICRASSFASEIGEIVQSSRHPGLEPGPTPSRINRHSVTGREGINVAAWIPAQGRDDEVWRPAPSSSRVKDGWVLGDLSAIAAAVGSVTPLTCLFCGL